VLETVFDAPGGRFRVLDFAPRFDLHGRIFRPTQILRLVEPLEGRRGSACDVNRSAAGPRPGRPSVKVRIISSTKVLAAPFGSRRTSAVLPRRPCVQSHEQASARADLGAVNRRAASRVVRPLLSETIRHWQEWVKYCDIPPLYQREVIRSALALKLNCFEDTGAIIAAVTTSIPEAPKSGRTWDYRYCWLRDAYYVVDAFRLLGHFAEREQFITYVLNVAGASPDLALAPALQCRRLTGSP